jgi:uncharacterized protein (TIGR00725 family)
MKIAIFSSWLPTVSSENRDLADEIGRYLAQRGVTVVTGGCSGIPALCVESAHSQGGQTVGYFPHKDHNEYYDRQHEENIHHIKYYTTAHFVHGFTARSLEMIKNVDAAIILGGRIGTLSEFGIAVEEGLPVGIIEGTGGISDLLGEVIRVSQKEMGNMIVFDNNYRQLVDTLINNHDRRAQVLT